MGTQKSQTPLSVWHLVRHHQQQNWSSGDRNGAGRNDIAQRHCRLAGTKYVQDGGKSTSTRTWALVYAHRNICVLSHSGMSDSLWAYGFQSTRLLCPWDFSGKNTDMGYHFLLQGSNLTLGTNPHLLHWQAYSLPPSNLGNPIVIHQQAKWHTIGTRTVLRLTMKVQKVGRGQLPDILTSFSK